MYACICHAVTEDRVAAEIADGARTVRELGSRCGAGTDCGSCIRRLACMLTKDGINHMPARPPVILAAAIPAPAVAAAPVAVAPGGPVVPGVPAPAEAAA